MDHNNLVLNTLETHLVPLQHAILQNTQENDDIISLDGNNSEIEVVYQRDTTFTEIARQLAFPTSSKDDKDPNNNQPSHNFTTPASQPQLQLNYTSYNINYYNNFSDVIVTQIKGHVTSLNVNNVIDVANVIDQVVISCGELMKLSDSIHIPKGQLAFVNLPLKDLRHCLNVLRYKPISEQSDFLLIKAPSILEDN